MSKITQREAIITALKHHGYTHLHRPNTTRYEAFVSNDLNGTRLYVGKVGAVRKGRTVTESVPISDKAKGALILKGTALLLDAKQKK